MHHASLNEGANWVDVCKSVRRTADEMIRAMG